MKISKNENENEKYFYFLCSITFKKQVSRLKFSAFKDVMKRHKRML